MRFTNGVGVPLQEGDGVLEVVTKGADDRCALLIGAGLDRLTLLPPPLCQPAAFDQTAAFQVGDTCIEFGVRPASGPDI